MDGDDIIALSLQLKCYAWLNKKGKFVYGLIHEKTIIFKQANSIDYVLQNKNEGLAKFIRNCPANSSCILLSVKRFFMSGGCEESFVSPDQILFLRLFASGKGVFLKETVASMPTKQTSESLFTNQKK